VPPPAEIARRGGATELEMAKQSRGQKKTVGRVMHEFKHGELETRGRKVKNPKQAVAIALHEAGASKYESKSKNEKNLRRTKAKERRGETARDQKEGRSRTAARRKSAGSARGKTRAELYDEAKRRNVHGRSTMSKAELERALHA
jgi:hypothetical protein